MNLRLQRRCHIVEKGTKNKTKVNLHLLVDKSITCRLPGLSKSYWEKKLKLRRWRYPSFKKKRRSLEQTHMCRRAEGRRQRLQLDDTV